jgi:hypothetical protein
LPICNLLALSAPFLSFFLPSFLPFFRLSAIRSRQFISKQQARWRQITQMLYVLLLQRAEGPRVGKMAFDQG